MAVGDLVVADYMYEFNGVVVGSGTGYITESWDGLFGMPDIRSNDLEPLDRHGVIPGSDYMNKRVISATVKTDFPAGADHEAAVQALTTAFRMSNAEHQLVFQRPGQDKRYVNCRARKFAYSSDYDFAHGTANVKFQLEASDPFHYSLTEHAAAATIIAGDTSGSTAAVNAGNWPTDWTLTIAGPAVNPKFTVSSGPTYDGTSYATRAVRILTSVPSGSELVIDSAKRSILLDGTSVYSLRAPDHQWWLINPGGTNLFTFTRDASSVGSAATATLRWHDRWVG